MSHRRERANSFIQEELSLLLQTELNDPRLAPLLITAVDVTADRRIARVYVAALSGEEDLQEGLKGLERAKPFLRRKLGEILGWRFTPELEFRPDRSLQHGQRIEAILAELERERAAREGKPTPPTQAEDKAPNHADHHDETR
ncbi:MAG: 30S ribosome-binding factor RbfA [Chloroflexi bacterium]|nr:30S ribosome-binding factor RbfA [Chloroflexota bacterium]